MAEASTADNLAAFIAAINQMADKIESLDEINQATAANPFVELATGAAIVFHGLVQEQSPYYTGTLHDAHRISEAEFSKTGKGFRASVDVYIDPDPTIINPVFGGFPGQYGPKYHREKRQWFNEAAVIMDPLFDRMLDHQVNLYFEDFW